MGIFMAQLKKVLYLVVALMVATFALSSYAGNNGKKQYILDVSPVAQGNPPVAPFHVIATVTNVDTGNSSAKSLKLFVGGLNIIDAHTDQGTIGSFTGSSVSVINMFPLKPGKAVHINLTVSTCGQGTWSGAVWTSTPFQGQMFNLVNNTINGVPCGNIACGDGSNSDEPLFVPDSLNPDTIQVVRGTWDKNGNQAGACSGIPYFVTNNIAVNDQLHFNWFLSGVNSDPAAAFMFDVFGNGPTPAQTNVAWFNTDGASADNVPIPPVTPDFIKGQLCNDYANFLPTPYGTLISDNGTTTLHVNTTAPLGVISTPVNFPTPLTSFDIVVQDERLTVSAIDATNTADEIWTISARNVGGVVSNGNIPHPAGKLVMSTPLPIMTAAVLAAAPVQVSGKYVANNQAQMCISDQFYDSESNAHTTTFIDIGDGWGGHP